MGISSKSLKAKADVIKAGNSTEAVIMPAAVFTEGVTLKEGTVAQPLEEVVTKSETVDAPAGTMETASVVNEEAIPISPLPGAKPIGEDGTVVEILAEQKEAQIPQVEEGSTLVTTVHAADPIESLKKVEEIVNESVEQQKVEEIVAGQDSQEDASNAESPIQSQPTLADSNAFQQLTRTSEETGIGSNSSYAELVESMVSQQCQLSGVKNLDLTTFGLRAQVLAFPNLSVMTYGSHKFLGAPFTEEEENLIVHRLAVHVAQSDKSRIVVKAVQEVKDERGMSFYSLLFDERIAQKFVNMFNYTVHANLNEADVSKLVLVIQK